MLLIEPLVEQHCAVVVGHLDRAAVDERGSIYRRIEPDDAEALVLGIIPYTQVKAWSLLKIIFKEGCASFGQIPDFDVRLVAEGIVEGVATAAVAADRAKNVGSLDRGAHVGVRAPR